MVCTFFIESMARGYHQYKDVWENPVYGEELNCARDIGNSHDPMAVYTISRLKEIAEEGTSLLNEPFGSGKSSLSAGFEVRRK